MGSSRWYTPAALGLRAGLSAPLLQPVPDDAPLALLRRQPWRFDLAMAVRLLETLDPGCVPVGTGAFPSREVVRFRQDPDFSTAPAAVAALHDPPDGQRQAQLLIRDGTLLGADGVLPYVYAAWIRELDRQGLAAPRAFLDLLQHRLTAVAVRAQRQMRPGLSGQPPERVAMTRWALSTLGLGLEATRNRLTVPDALVLRQAPLFLGRARSAVGLERAVTDLMRSRPNGRSGAVSARLTPFVGGWHPLPQRFRSRLGDVWGQGGDNIRLGTTTQGGTAVLGRRVYDPAAAVQLDIGPLSLERFVSLLPLPEAPADGDWRRLTDLVRFYLVSPLTVRVRLTLAPQQRPPLRLGAPLARLGWSSWLTAGRPARQPADHQVVLTLPQVWAEEAV